MSRSPPSPACARARPLSKAHPRPQASTRALLQANWRLPHAALNTAATSATPVPAQALCPMHTYLAHLVCVAAVEAGLRQVWQQAHDVRVVPQQLLQHQLLAVLGVQELGGAVAKEHLHGGRQEQQQASRGDVKYRKASTRDPCAPPGQLGGKRMKQGPAEASLLVLLREGKPAIVVARGQDC
eukprot:364815-Chlamydomonas_euryale.AAC.14